MRSTVFLFSLTAVLLTGSGCGGECRTAGILASWIYSDCEDDDDTSGSPDPDVSPIDTTPTPTGDDDTTVSPTPGTDADGDGVTKADGDCNDADAAIYPGASEVSDGVDNNCDGALNPNEQDNDGDGYAPYEGDCYDTNPYVQPYQDSTGAWQCVDVLGHCSGGEVRYIYDADDWNFAVIANYYTGDTWTWQVWSFELAGDSPCHANLTTSYVSEPYSGGVDEWEFMVWWTYDVWTVEFWVPASAVEKECGSTDACFQGTNPEWRQAHEVWAYFE